MTRHPLKKMLRTKAMAISVSAAMVMSGCVAGRVTPPETTVKTLRTIAVVPVEAPPLLLHAKTPADRKAVSALGLSPAGSTSVSLDPLGITFVYLAVVVPIKLVASSVPRSGEVAAMTGEPPPAWMPTVGLGQKAAELLQGQGLHEAFTVEGYARLPIEDRRVNPYLENFMAPVRRWYNADISTIDYAQWGMPPADAILEVGVLNYEYGYASSDILSLQVMVKLVDPASRRVLGRARNFDNPKAGSFTQVLQNEGQPLKALIAATGERLLIKCLRDLGLYGP